MSFVLKLMSFVLKLVIFVFKDDEFCVKHDDFCIKDDEFCIIKEDDFCIKIDEFCIKIDEFSIKIDDVCVKNDEFCSHSSDGLPFVLAALGVAGIYTTDLILKLRGKAAFYTRNDGFITEMTDLMLKMNFCRPPFVRRRARAVLVTGSFLKVPNCVLK